MKHTTLVLGGFWRRLSLDEVFVDSFGSSQWGHTRQPGRPLFSLASAEGWVCDLGAKKLKFPEYLPCARLALSLLSVLCTWECVTYIVSYPSCHNQERENVPIEQMETLLKTKNLGLGLVHIANISCIEYYVVIATAAVIIRGELMRFPQAIWMPTQVCLIPKPIQIPHPHPATLGTSVPTRGLIFLTLKDLDQLKLLNQHILNGLCC